MSAPTTHWGITFDLHRGPTEGCPACEDDAEELVP